MAEDWPIIARQLTKFGIDDPCNCVGIIGTIAKESASTFKPVREAYWLYDRDPAAAYRYYASVDPPRKAAYGGGPDYHGRGYLQTTHLSNYQRVQDVTGLPVVAKPDLLLEAEAAAAALCIWWTDRPMSYLCKVRDWAEVRRRVLGGPDPDGVQRIRRVADLLLPLAAERGFL